MTKTSDKMIVDDPDLVIDPKDFVTFTTVRPDEPLQATLKLTNRKARSIAYKIKVTASKVYCVKPNNGIIKPGSSENVLLVLTDNDEVSNIVKHRFMVQYAFVPNNASYGPNLWNNINPDQVKAHKLNVKLGDSVSSAKLAKSASDTRSSPGLDMRTRELPPLPASKPSPAKDSFTLTDTSTTSDDSRRFKGQSDKGFRTGPVAQGGRSFGNDLAPQVANVPLGVILLVSCVGVSVSMLTSILFSVFIKSGI